MPLCESSTAAAPAGLDAEAPRRLEVDVGRRLAARDLLRRDRRLRRARATPSSSSDEVDQLAVRRGRERERPARGKPLDGLARAGKSGEPLAVERLQPAHDLGGDLLRRLGQADHARACSATTRASSCPSCPAARGRASGRRAPARAPRARRPRPAPSRAARRRDRRRRRRSQGRVALAVEDERALGRAGLGALDGADEEGVVAGLVDVGRPAARASPTRALELRRAVHVAQRDVLPERDRRDAAREVLGERRPGPSASRLTANSPASRSSSFSAASVRTATPTSGGSSESETSEATVSPTRWPCRSTVTTDDTRRKPGHDRTQLVAVDHAAIIRRR